jgi:hypothetical protein
MQSLDAHNIGSLCMLRQLLQQHMGMRGMVFRLYITSLSSAAIYIDSSQMLARVVFARLRAFGSSSVTDITVSDVAQSIDVSFPPSLLQFHLPTLARLTSPSPPDLLLQASRVKQPPLPPRAQSVKGKLRAELEEALERERQMLQAQGEYDESEDASTNSSTFPAKIQVVEDLPWQKFVESNFGANASVQKREFGRCAAVNIQRILRGFLVGIFVNVHVHTSISLFLTSHVTRLTSQVRKPRPDGAVQRRLWARERRQRDTAAVVLQVELIAEIM